MIAEDHDQRENTAFAEASNAFDSAGAYSWCGHALTWAERHNWLWISVIRRANYEPEQNALAMMWIGTREDIKAAERRWRRDPEDIYGELSDFMAQFMDTDPEVAEALEVAEKISADIEASTDEPEGAGRDAEGAPKKSPVEQAIASILSGLQGSARTPSAINSPTPKGSSY